MREHHHNCDTAEDTRCTLQVNGATWTVCPEPDQLMAFSAALVRLQDSVRAGTTPAEDVAPRTAVLVRDHLLGTYRPQYDACGAGKKLAIISALWEAFVGPLGQVAPDPTNGRSAPTAPPAGGSIGSPDSAAPMRGPSLTPSSGTTPAPDGMPTNPWPPPSETPSTSLGLSATVAVQTPPSASMSFSNSARSAGSE